MKHPSNRAERKRLVEAKALASPLYRQRKVNSSKRKKLNEIKDKEDQNELLYTDVGNFSPD